ncbi:helix-turn-helix transcriptional regulator [Lutimaribacter marinistellae]|uniref:Helix-turn-helix transcriptional regulator n=1 Tax=Lutimaribacter marinistellae TaxID=1820329 RepID=A0ABV7TPZ5_9RHOB
MRRHLGADTLPSSPSASRQLTRLFFRHLARHYADGKPLAHLAASLSITPTHLTRVCKVETGRTAASLMTDRILHAARLLLASTDVPAKDIARHLGFGSQAYFTRFIQNHTGQTPSNLRRATA